jgi:3-hydroxy-9,10-secoandrosta-1,3,5(10)-triene-9,17-dione monooxygenase
MQRAGEGTVTSREIVARAEALRPALLERQAEAEELTYYPESTHREFLEAGFYRILQPRRYGGLELDVPTFVRVIMEVSRGCVSTGWCLCLSSAHVLQVASAFGEEAQEEIFGDDGDFRCASFGAPVGVAEPVDGGWEIECHVPVRVRHPVLDPLPRPDLRAGSESGRPAGPADDVRRAAQHLGAPG